MRRFYGKAPIGAPPMSVPHLDRRIINNKPALLSRAICQVHNQILQGSIFDPASSQKFQSEADDLKWEPEIWT